MCVTIRLATYAMPYSKAIPVIRMDEQRVQLLKETRQAIVATINHPQRVDYEYERAGTASIYVYGTIVWMASSKSPAST